MRGFKIGADDYLTKPFDSEVLLAKIKAILNRINFFNLWYMSNQGIKRVVCTISNFAASKSVLCILLNLNYIVEIQPFQLSITFFYNSTLIHIILFNLNRDSFMKWISFVN